MVSAPQVFADGGNGMIDFTGLTTTRKAYGGANGGKIAIIYEGEQ